MFPVKVPWTTKPPVGTPIDFGNPFVKDMFFFCAMDRGGDQVNLIDGAIGVRDTSGPTATATLKATSYGLVQDFELPADETEWEGFNWGNRPEYQPTELTIITRARAEGESHSGGSRIVSKQTGSSDDYSIYLSATREEWRCRINGSDDVLNPSGHTTLDGVLFDLALSVNTADQYNYAWEPELGDTMRRDQNATGATVNQNSGPLCIGIRGNSQERMFDGEIHYVAIWNKWRDQDFITAFRKNPWQIFQPQTRWIPLDQNVLPSSGMIPIRVPWTSKPSHGGFTKLRNEWTNQLLGYIDITAPSASIRETVDGVDAVWGGTGDKRTILPDGSLAARFDDANNFYVTTPGETIVTNEDFTMIWVGVPHVDGTDREAIFSSGQYSPGVYAGANTAGVWGIYWNGWDDSSITVVNDILTTVVLRRISNNLQLFVNGELAVDIASKNSSMSASNWNLGWAGSAGNHRGQTDMAFWAVYKDRGFSTEEVKRISANPWGVLFQPQTIWIPVVAPAAAVPSADMMPIQVPWTHYPPNRIEQFDKSNRFGSKCLWAVVPGWDDFEGDGTANLTAGKFSSVGQKMDFPLTEYGSSNSLLNKVTRSHTTAGGSMQTALFTPAGQTASITPVRTTNDLGIIFPDSRNWTFLAIFKPTNDGRPGGGDPRLFSKDLGTAQDDHDLMIGIAGVGTRGRIRVKIGASNTYTLLTGASEPPQQDALNLIAGSMIGDSATASRLWIQLLREDGLFYDQVYTGSFTNGYEPRTTTDMGFGSTASSPGTNAYDGEIIGVWAFDGAMLEADLRTFFNNPWQVFQPQTRWIPIGSVAAGTTVIVTDVNGTEIWIDGATGLVITGTGFA